MAGFKQWRADRAAAQQKAQAIAKANSDFCSAAQFAFPQDLTVYDEDPTRAAALLKDTANYLTVHCSNYVYFTPAPWQLPAMRNASALPLPFQTNRNTPLFLHARVSGGVERVVFVEFLANENINNEGRAKAAYYISNARLFMAQSYSINPDGTFKTSPTRSLEVTQPFLNRTSITWTPGPDDRMETGQIRPQLSNIFHLFAGQPDTSDLSHFTIHYELDGKKGVIDGWLLKDLTVALQPREGCVVNNDPVGRQRTWDPYASLPSTHPVAPPDLPPVHKN